MAKVAVGLPFNRNDKSKILMRLFWDCRSKAAFTGFTVRADDGVDPVPGLSEHIKDVTGCTVYETPVMIDSVDDEVSYYTVSLADDEVEQKDTYPGLLVWIPTRTLYTHPEYFGLHGLTKEILDAAMVLASTAFT